MLDKISTTITLAAFLAACSIEPAPATSTRTSHQRAAAAAAAPKASPRVIRDRSVCIPKPSDHELHGKLELGDVDLRSDDPWEPRCDDFELMVAPCQIGTVEISPGEYSCSCTLEVDCRGMALAVGQRYYLGSMPGLTSRCDAGRCVWTATP